MKYLSIRKRNLINRIESLFKKRTISVEIHGYISTPDFGGISDLMSIELDNIVRYDIGSDETLICIKSNKDRMSFENLQSDKSTSEVIEKLFKLQDGFVGRAVYSLFENIFAINYNEDVKSLSNRFPEFEEIYKSFENHPNLQGSYYAYKRFASIVNNQQGDIVRNSRVFKEVLDIAESVRDAGLKYSLNDKVYPKLKDRQAFPLLRIKEKDDGIHLVGFDSSPGWGVTKPFPKACLFDNVLDDESITKYDAAIIGTRVHTPIKMWTQIEDLKLPNGVTILKY